MNKQARVRWDQRLAKTVELRQYVSQITLSEKLEMLDSRRQEIRYLQRNMLLAIAVLACIAWAFYSIFFTHLTSMHFTVGERVALSVPLAYAAYRTIKVMDITQIIYHVLVCEIGAIIEGTMPESSRSENW